ncbi:two-component system regulatory protein YycI [Companilactobacillus huachuanensis]|uniref:Two-component system regulatory protein YycI n=1 Tax=Companilactobacillus huachuanensis TaxID=2559914 RepID=A0ABW1RN10_9LACO|nr:two-component system regulatory protein YycI [Companilactobacillus huachuanensis]
MDFRRIEVIFLIVFFSLDIFLFLSFRNSQQLVSSTSNNTSTVAEMHKRNISFGSLDTKSGYAYYLGSQPDESLAQNLQKLNNQKINYEEVNHMISSTLNDPITVTNADRKDVMNRFVQKDSNILFGKQYKYAPQLSTNSQIVYVRTGSLGEVYDKTAQLVFSVSDGEVVGYTQTYVDSMIILHEKQAIKSEKDVITNLYANSEIPNNSKISYANLAYTKLLEAKNSTIYIPVWFVTIKNKDSKVSATKKVNAFTGNIIKSSTNGDNYSAQ